MSLFLVDVSGTDLLYTQTTQFEGVEYLLRFWWSARERAWYVDFNGQDGTPIAPFIRLVIGASLLRRFKDPRLPPGVLFVYDLTGEGRDIEEPTDLGVRVPLAYLTSDDPLLQPAVAA